MVTLRLKSLHAPFSIRSTVISWKPSICPERKHRQHQRSSQGQYKSLVHNSSPQETQLLRSPKIPASTANPEQPFELGRPPHLRLRKAYPSILRQVGPSPATLHDAEDHMLASPLGQTSYELPTEDTHGTEAFSTGRTRTYPPLPLPLHIPLPRQPAAPPHTVETRNRHGMDDARPDNEKGPSSSARRSRHVTQHQGMLLRFSSKAPC